MSPDTHNNVPGHREILDALGAAVLVLDEALRVTWLNASAQSLLGAGIRQLEGRSLLELLAGGESSPLESLHRRLARALESSEACAVHEIGVRPLSALAGGDEERVVDVYATPLETQGGKAATGRCLLVEIVDATQRRRISRESALLAQLGGSRSMVRQLAHEIKNPLGGVRGAAQLLARQLGEGALREYTTVILNEVDRLAALVDSMLGPSRPPRKERLNLHEICEHVFHLLRGEAANHVIIERDYDPSLPEIGLDRNMIVQAMLNLGRNALQAGGGRILLRTRVVASQNIGGVRHRLVAAVQFEDDGPGVPAEIRDTLFYPLVTGRADGTGLGLAVAQELAIRHGGLIEFESVPGQTRFTILLPLIPASAEGKEGE